MSPILESIGSVKGFGWGAFADGSSFQSISTVTVGSGGSASISFTSIPATYTHLQIRYSAFTNRPTYGIDSFYMQFNSVGGTSYSRHDLRGDGSSVSAGSGTSQSAIDLNFATLGTTVISAPGVGVIDILDYTNANKYKTVRYLGGVDVNGTIAGFGGAVIYASGLFMSTNSISSIFVAPNVGPNFAEYSQFALYGVRGA